MASSPPAPTPLAVTVAAFGLPGAGPAGFPVRPLEPPDWVEAFDDILRRRLVGLLAAAVEAGAVPVTEEQRSDVAAAHGAAMARVLDIEATAVAALAVLDGCGLRSRVLKGLATAHLDFPDPAQRVFGDADVLVAPREMSAAVTALEAVGHRRDLPERRAGFDDRFGKEVTLYAPTAIEVDVHRTLTLGAFGLAIPLDELWSEGEAFSLGGRGVQALRPEHRLLNAAYSAITGDAIPRLVALRDVAQLLVDPATDVDAARATAERWRAGVVLAEAVAVAGRTLGGGREWPLWPWARSYRPPAWEARALRAYESQGGSNARTFLSGVLGLRGTGERAAYLWALARPDAAYVASRRRAGRPVEWTQGLRELAPGRRRLARRER